MDDVLITRVWTGDHREDSGRPWGQSDVAETALRPTDGIPLAIPHRAAATDITKPPGPS